jgi:hypothetical protein
MKFLTLLVLLAGTSLFACTGDCLTCHPSLLATINSDERHKPMLTCIECHAANSDSMAECGSDCFSCHSMEKIDKANISEHRVIRQCRECHLQLKKELFSMQPGTGQSHEKSLKDVLLP